MKTETRPILIRPVDAAMGIYRVAIYYTDDNGAITWHRHRGTLDGAIAFCKRHGCEYSIAD